MKKYLCHEAIVLESSPLAAGQHLLTLKAPGLASRARPGQFVHVLLPGEGLDPFLRRPFSLAAAFPEEEKIQLFFRLVGGGTSILSRLQAGETLDCLGPLGRGFSPPLPGEKPVLIAGGIGAAPLWFLKLTLQNEKTPFHFFWGAASRNHFFLLHDFEKGENALSLATDDGSLAFHGPVTKPLEKFLQQNTLAGLRLYACGPAAMLKKVQAMAAQHQVPLEISLEERMACGIGACLGCAVRKKNPAGKGEKIHFSRVCFDGPVFPGEEVIINA